jgi:hypothetical protein
MVGRPATAIAAAVLAFGLSTCSDDGAQRSERGEPTAFAAVEPPADPETSPPPANGELDYQLGGAYEPSPDVEVLVRDRTAEPDPDRYTICYVNGFQTQPDEARFWREQHPDLVLRDEQGHPLIDPEWPDEYILDISTASNRQRLARIVGEWIDGCVAHGFQAVEIDNLDTYTRFPDQLTEPAAVGYSRLLADRAHAAGAAIGQKNGAELVGRRAEMGFDFSVVEQCNEYSDETYKECEQFTAGYGDQVYVIEYEPDAFEAGCAAYPELSIVLRDREVTPPASPTHVRRAC